MWFVFALLPFVQAKFYESNVTDLSKCKVYYARSDGVYRDFFEVAKEEHHNDTLFDFHFSVLGPSDAHILLAPSSTLKKSDSAYEIVLGAGGNMFSDIRRAQKALVKASLRQKGLLSGLDPRSFWIHVKKDGTIEVGREGEELGFISWRDTDPLPIKYFSFGTWPGIEAKWYFDCPREDKTTSNSTEVIKPLTDLEKLRQDYLSFYDPYVRPTFDVTTLTTVSININLHYVSLDEYKSTLEVRGKINLVWTDEKMKWNATDYGNIKTLHLPGRQIWQPDLVLYNAVDSVGRDILDQNMLVVTNKGIVYWNTSTHMKAWCKSNEILHWPEDIHVCELLLSFGSDFNFLQLQFDDIGSQILGEKFQTEWDVLEVTSFSNYGGKQHDSFNPENAPFLKLTFTLKRNSSVYGAVFFTPFLVVAISMLATFCVSPFGCLKISLGCLQLILISLMLVNLAEFIPIHPQSIPYFVALYSLSCLASLGCILISIIVINLSRTRSKQPVPHCIWNMLTSLPIRTILLLPKVKISDDYGKLDDASVAKYDESVQNMWILCGKAIDRVAFIFYLGVIVYAVVCRY